MAFLAQAYAFEVLSFMYFYTFLNKMILLFLDVTFFTWSFITIVLEKNSESYTIMNSYFTLFYYHLQG